MSVSFKPEIEFECIHRFIEKKYVLSFYFNWKKEVVYLLTHHYYHDHLFIKIYNSYSCKTKGTGQVSSVQYMYLQMGMRCWKRARPPLLFSLHGCDHPQIKAKNWYFWYLDSEFVIYLMQDYGLELYSLFLIISLNE